MKTIEELKSMTQEDLVCLVQEQQEEIAKLENSNKMIGESLTWFSSQNKEIAEKAKTLINALDGVLTMGKEIQW